MRQIKFRGRVIDSGEWIKGDLIQDGHKKFIYPSESGWFELAQSIRMIHPLTASQFTGLHDKNGKEIYEGDILRPSLRIYSPGVVEYVDYRFRVRCGREYVSLSPTVCKSGEVIGNIHENPELLQ